MKSDIWLARGYKKGDGVYISEGTIDYHIWFNQVDEPIGVTIDFELADDVHYELDYVDWVYFIENSLHTSISSVYDEALKIFFSKADYYSFEKVLVVNGIEFSKIAYY